MLAKNIEFSRQFVGNVTNILKNYNAKETDYHIVCEGATAITISLFKPVVGQLLRITNVGPNAVTVAPPAGGTISGKSSMKVMQYETLEIQGVTSLLWELTIPPSTVDEGTTTNKFLLWDETERQHKAVTKETFASALELPPYAPLTDVIHADLFRMLEDAELIPGMFYRITDYRTIHEIPNTTVEHEGGHEPLVVLATSVNSFSKQAWSRLYPKDYIEYDINDQVYGILASYRPGFITRRIDDLGNDCPYDHRNVLFRRWGLDLSSFSRWDDFDYGFGAKVVQAVDGVDTVYYCIKAVTSATGLTPNNDSEHWNWVIDKNRRWCYQLADNAFGADPVNEDANYFSADVEDYEDYYTFNGTGCVNNIIKKWTGGLNNIVFFGNGCYSNTFGNNCNSNTFGNNCNSNTFGNNYYYNTFGNNYYYNTFGNDCNSNTFGNSCDSNTFGNSCQSNTFGNNCQFNTFGYNCGSNTFGNSCNYNFFGNSCSSNAFGNSCFSNTFGYDCYSNTFGNDYYSNTFGNDCYSNTFGNSYDSNTFGNSCQSNTFGDGCSNLPLSGKTIINNIFGNNLDFDGINFSSVTHLLATYECKIFKREDGTIRLSYINNSDVTVVVNVNA